MPLPGFVWDFLTANQYEKAMKSVINNGRGRGLSGKFSPLRLDSRMIGGDPGAYFRVFNIKEYTLARINTELESIKMLKKQLRRAIIG